MDFSADFFKKEERCGFEISATMKRLWAAELEVLRVVSDICDRKGLTYYADGGTMLGAVRHQGFIPWDDDIDICMMRESYQELISILPEELPRGFVMAGMYADSARLQQAQFEPHIKVMADEALWNYEDYMKKFHGFPYPRIGIDIFPLDYLPRDRELVNLQKSIMAYGINLLNEWDIYARQDELELRILNMEKLCAVTIPRDDNIKNTIWRLIDSVSALYQCDEADEVAVYAFYLTHPCVSFRKEWFQKTVYLPFETTQMPVPGDYEQILTICFGDYMKPIRGTATHDYPCYGHMEDWLIGQLRAGGFPGTVEEFCQKVVSGELSVEGTFDLKRNE